MWREIPKPGVVVLDVGFARLLQITIECADYSRAC